VLVPQPNWYTGLAFDTHGATGPLLVKEIVLDADLDHAVDCGSGSFNLALWDVTDPASPFVPAGGRISHITSPRNHRNHLPVELVLAPGRAYRLVARVRGLRTSPVEGPGVPGPLNVLGGLYFADPAPCGGAHVAAALVQPSTIPLSLRFVLVPAHHGPDPVGPSLLADRVGGRALLAWQDVGAAAYRVQRCNATAGPCLPAPIAMTPDPTYVEPPHQPSPGQRFWYLVQAVNKCTAEM
jgi:hypothetical protein